MKKFLKIVEILPDQSSIPEEKRRKPEICYYRGTYPNNYILTTDYKRAFRFEQDDPNLKDVYKILKKDFRDCHVFICNDLRG